MTTTLACKPGALHLVSPLPTVSWRSRLPQHVPARRRASLDRSKLLPITRYPPNPLRHAWHPCTRELQRLLGFLSFSPSPYGSLPSSLSLQNLSLSLWNHPRALLSLQASSSLCLSMDEATRGRRASMANQGGHHSPPGPSGGPPRRRASSPTPLPPFLRPWYWHQRRPAVSLQPRRRLPCGPPL